MDQQEREKLITFTQDDKTIQLPLPNVLRLSLYYLRPMVDRYKTEMSDGSIEGFYDWMSKFLELDDEHKLLL